MQAETVYNMTLMPNNKSVLDHEFVERGGALHAARIVADEQLSKMLSRASRDVATRQPLVQPDYDGRNAAAGMALYGAVWPLH